MTKRNLLTFIMILVSAVSMAQDAKALYKEAKELCDANEYVKAMTPLRKAAEMGHKKAQFKLGRCYDKGEGVPEDNIKAFQWYFKSAQQGYDKAQYQVGRCYKKGKGVAKDPQKAYEYFVKAAKQDNANGELALAKHFLKQGDKAKAKQWCLRAIRNQDGGDKILAELREDSAKGDMPSKILLTLVGK